MRLNKRHVAKSFSWRIVGTLDTLIFAWLLTGNLYEGLNISGITTVTKLIWYYFHERWWFNSSVHDSNKRHIIKTFTWRGIGTLDTIFFSFLITGNPLMGLKIGFIETVTKMILYYLHEKLWYKTNYGLEFPNKSKHKKLKYQKKSN